MTYTLCGTVGWRGQKERRRRTRDFHASESNVLELENEKNGPDAGRNDDRTCAVLCTIQCAMDLIRRLSNDLFETLFINSRINV